MQLSAIKRIEQRTREIPGVISLAQGIPSFPSDEILREGVFRAIRENKVDKYSPITGIPELREIIAQKLAARGIHYDPASEIIVTAGAIEALASTMLALVPPDSEVILLTPTYPYYARQVRLAKATPVSVPLDETNGWSLDFKKLEQTITKKTKAIVLCNPNNPTGSVLSKDELINIADLCKAHGIVMIGDDVYDHFYYGEDELYTPAMDKQYRDIMVRIVSFSKDLALSGWRIGFLHTDKSLGKKILPVHDAIVNCAPVVSQYAALTGLQNEAKIVPASISEYKKRRDLICQLLDGMSDYLSYVKPEGAYYIFPKIKNVTNVEDLAFDILEKAKVGMVPGDEFGLGGEGHLRICFGKSEEDIQEAMQRVKNYFKTADLTKFK